MSAAGKNFTQVFKRGLIVSCQADPEEPLYGSEFMSAMALASEHGGAVGVRVNSPEDIRAVKRAIKLPVIGIYKVMERGSQVYITPGYEYAERVAEAGADAVAIDATERKRSRDETVERLVKRIKEDLGVFVVADISTQKEGLAAASYGADAVATTLSGYTAYTRRRRFPDIALIKQLARRLKIPVIAEGGYYSPEEAVRAIKAGAYAVVVGTAITRPQKIAEGFSEEIRRALKGRR